MICVTGPGRSGTSLTTGVVQLLGLDMGAKAQITHLNEDIRVWRLHKRIYAHFGGSDVVSPSLPDGWERQDDLDGFRREARTIVADGRTLMKDPRLSLLLPFWRIVTDVDATVLAVRNPAATALSLTTRDCTENEWGLWHWQHYVRAALVNDPEAVVVDYDEWFDHPQQVVDRLVARLGLEPPSEEVRTAVAELIRPDLNHGTGLTQPTSETGRQAIELWEDVTSGCR